MAADADQKRRQALTLASLGGAAIATAGVAGAFGMSLAPSRRTKGEGAPVEVSLASVEPSKLRVVSWRRKPVWVLARTPEQIASLEDTADLADPDSENSEQPEYCRNATRSISPEMFVAVGICTHLGCSPGAAFPKGFLCACHGSYFDLAGRVFAGSPAPTNLSIPEHYFTEHGTLVIGASAGAANA